MWLTTDRLTRLQRSLELALNQEWPQLDQTQRRLAKRTATRHLAAAAQARRLRLAALDVPEEGRS